MEGQQQNVDRFREYALGLVSTPSFPAIVGTADSMVKAAAVTLVGYEMIGAGQCTAIVRGRVSDVHLAVATGVETAQQFGQVISSHVIPRPSPNLEAVLPIGHRLAQLTQNNGRSRLSNLAVGLIETRGFPAMVGAADAMLKSAEVHFSAYETIGSGLCTAIIRGVVSNVAIAIEAGMEEAERIGELSAVMVVPMPLDDLERTLPVASCWIEQPLQLPLHLKQKEKVLVELPASQERSRSEPALSE